MTSGSGLHVRELSRGPAGAPLLLCLHPAPFDGGWFAPLADALTEAPGPACTVLAPDYPGYGLSPPLSQRPSIADYARTVAACLDTDERPAAALGFHTGCLVAAELALRMPERISHLILIDVPYYVGRDQQQHYAESVTGDRQTDGFRAAFSYECNRLTQLRHPTLVIATGGNLRQPTAEAAALIPAAQFADRPAITRPAMQNGAGEFAALIGPFLQG